LRELRGFKRIHLAPGQSQSVTFTLRERDLSIVDADGKRHIATGRVQAWIGGGQPSGNTSKVAGVSTAFEITSAKVLAD
jgi:beta-glucosidase